MRYILHQMRLAKTKAQRNGYAYLALGLLCLALLQSGFLFWQAARTRVIVIPPVMHQPFWVSQQSVSATYLADMGRFLASVRLNLTPNNSAQAYQTLLRYTDPRYYPTLKAQLRQEGRALQKAQLSWVFYPTQVIADPKHLAVKLTGFLRTQIADNPLHSQAVSYRLHFRYQQGHLWLSAFKRISPHEKNTLIADRTVD